MTMPTAGVGNAAATTNLPKIVVTEDGKRMGLVSEQTIRKLQSPSLASPTRAYPAEFYNAEFMRKIGFDEEVIDKLLRAYEAMQVFRDIQKDVLQQYNARGYAYLQIYKDDPQDMDEQIRLLTMEIGKLTT